MEDLGRTKCLLRFSGYKGSKYKYSNYENFLAKAGVARHDQGELLANARMAYASESIHIPTVLHSDWGTPELITPKELPLEGVRGRVIGNW